MIQAVGSVSPPIRHPGVERATFAMSDPGRVRANLEAGGTLLICTDGLPEMLDDGQLAKILQATVDLQGACEQLIAAANERVVKTTPP